MRIRYEVQNLLNLQVKSDKIKNVAEIWQAKTNAKFSKNYYIKFSLRKTEEIYYEKEKDIMHATDFYDNHSAFTVGHHG